MVKILKVDTDAEILEFATVDNTDQAESDCFNTINRGTSRGTTFIFDPLFLGVDYRM